MEEKHNYTISVYTENNIGLLNRISSIFSKRHINLDSFTASESEIKDVYRFIIVVKMTEDAVKKIIGQIEKQIEVIKAFYHRDDQTVFMETALFKIKTALFFDQPAVQNAIKNHHAQIVTADKAFFVIELTDNRDQVTSLYDTLKPFGLMQFVRSGRIAITKTPMNISEILSAFSDDVHD